MAHMRKGQLARNPEWWKHLRRYASRRFWKRERQLEKQEVRR